jgi:hypothetical protein
MKPANANIASSQKAHLDPSSWLPHVRNETALEAQRLHRLRELDATIQPVKGSLLDFFAKANGLKIDVCEELEPATIELYRARNGFSPTYPWTMGPLEALSFTSTPASG